MTDPIPGEILLVLKKSAYQIYVREHGDPRVAQLVEQDDAAVAHMLPGDEAHQRTLDKLLQWLAKQHLPFRRVYREELGGTVPRTTRLVVAVGGDGTVLDASHHVRDVPLLGINSDPLRSTGYLCAATAKTLVSTLEDVLDERMAPTTLARMCVQVGKRTLRPPALNDALVAHPNPAATSRYRIVSNGQVELQRSSGLWIATPAGSTAAIRSAGGRKMPLGSKRLQFRVREPVPPATGPPPSMEGGYVVPGDVLELEWCSRVGRVYLDGAHISWPLHMGDRVRFTGDGAPLKLYRPRQRARIAGRSTPDAGA